MEEVFTLVPVVKNTKANGKTMYTKVLEHWLTNPVNTKDPLRTVSSMASGLKSLITAIVTRENISSRNSMEEASTIGKTKLNT